MGRRRRQTDLLVPGAEAGLDRLKYEVASELGLTPGPVQSEQQYRDALDRLKWEIASSLGLDQRIREVGFGNMTSRECGQLGGQMGGRIGGRMVQQMLRSAEEQLGHPHR